MGLDASLGVQLGSLDLDAHIAVADGEVVAVLGPNGAGKTTALRCLAGLITLDRGRIELDGDVLDDASSGAFVAAEGRHVGVVFQDYLLFAHLSALENVAFGLRARGVGKSEARRRAAEWLDRVGLSAHARHRPRALSGGQAQRVALARALATQPRMLLLDEPLAALDVGTRGDVRRDLRRHLDSFGGSTLVVTHDPVDAYALADRVIVLEAGHISQQGTLAEVTAQPRSRYVAELVGVNLIAGTLRGGVLQTDEGAAVVTAGDTPDGPALAVIRPQSISLYRSAPEGSPRNSWQCTVTDLDQRGERVRVLLGGPLRLVAEITPGALAAIDVRPGDEVWATVKATEISTSVR
jgi:molybdate transport system ATP-binding protein